MQTQAIFDKMVAIITPFAKNAAALSCLTEDTHITDDLKVNSARLVDIIIEAEDAFGIEIADEEADTIETVGDAVRIIRSKLQ